MKNGKIMLERQWNYTNPKIPKGYTHLKGTWDTGFVIQNKTDGSEFVWIPVGFLDPDGSLDRSHFNEKLGKMDWHTSHFAKELYYEELNKYFIESVKKYGGFYFASYHASEENGKLVFKKGNIPWVNINYFDAENAAKKYAKIGKDFKSCITSGVAFDTILRWIIKAKAKTYDEVVKDSTSWGNYLNTHNSPRELMPTGSNEKWKVFNIYDLAGNVDEWTSEKHGHSNQILRGGNWESAGNYWPVSDCYRYSPYNNYASTSFRAMLYLK